MAAMLWQPSPERVANANITRFAELVRDRHGVNADGYAALHRWSIENREAFWSLVWDFAGVVGDRGNGPVLVDGDRMPGAKWFPRARLNFAENLLRRRDDAPGIVFRGEDRVRRTLSFQRVARRGVDARPGAAWRRGGAGRPRGRLPAQSAGSRHCDAGDREHRGHLVVGFSGLRSAGGGGPLRSDRAEGAVQRRRLLLRRKAVRLDGPAGGNHRTDTVDRAYRGRAVHDRLARSIRSGQRCRAWRIRA